ncbi:hypothetical protein Pla100_39990 [Neorhodopirellula pilleata]|uniref:Uncharacterized protein n=1 Tax=Neorhodopirellula pilleata TaxID=2714738 RepID=A0A5C6A4S2_9BACT|nr:hypothetical protein Pla100_39990 [Neorhodopirellula pilleata]
MIFPSWRVAASAGYEPKVCTKSIKALTTDSCLAARRIAHRERDVETSAAFNSASVGSMP